MHIFFLTTGGTIDKDYPHATKGWAFDFGDQAAVERIVRERLSFPRPSFTYSFHKVCQKDSLEITDEDREKLDQEIHRLYQEQIVDERGYDKGERPNIGFVVTHGTDTLLDTALYLQKSVKAHDGSSPFAYKICLTGAMRPERFSNSDAAFNVGMAVAAVQIMSQPNVVHVCMHGVVKPATEMERNTTTGQFS